MQDSVAPVDKSVLMNHQVNDKVVGPVDKAVALRKWPGKGEQT